jgi:amino acid adenylation domain-containing protein
MGATDERARKAYWRDRLRDAPVVELPFERPAVASAEPPRGRVTVPLPADLSPRLRELADGEQAHVTEVIAVALAVLLGRYAMQDDVVVGVHSAEVSFAWPLRVSLARQATVRALIRAAGEQARAAARHPMSASAVAAAVATETGAPPIVPFASAVVEGAVPADLDLVVVVESSDGVIHAVIDHDARRFGHAAVTRLATHLTTLVEAMVSAPDALALLAPLLTAAGEQTVVALGSGDTIVDPFVRVDALFRATAARQPEWPALKRRDRALTYGELAERANRLAQWLRKKVPGRSEVIGILFERSPEFVVAQLAVWTAGHACVPLDVKAPADRRAQMLTDAGAKLLLYSESATPAFDGTPCPTVAVESLRDALAAEPNEPPSCETPPLALAYIIFTSGSTGAPKGVVVPHAGLSNLLQNNRRKLTIGQKDRVAQMAAVWFDSSIESLWSPLTLGATLVFVEDDVKLSPPAFKALVLAEGITRCGMPSSLFEAMLGEDWSDTKLTHVGTGLEKLHKIEKKLPFTLGHAYGPTECTVGVTRIVGFTEFPPPIGTPHDNIRVYVLDENLALLPHGALGEGYIAGICVARGYLRSDLTAERFLPDPYGPPGSRMYKTGDILRFREDGNIVFCGRADRQIKLRGFRVEPGEIETVIRSEPEASEAVVVALGEDPSRPDRLVAYVVPRQGMTSADLSAALLPRLRARLPHYMIPSAIVALERIPLTATGKIDHKALPHPTRDVTTPSATNVAPRTPSEEAVALTFSELLGVPSVGVQDDFFALGGHSLLAHRLVARIKERLGVSIAERILFEAPTVEKLAARIDEVMRGKTGPRLERVAERHTAPLSFNQVMWWRRQQHRPESPGFNFVHAYRIRGALDVAVLRRAVDEEVRRHDALRTTFELVDGEPVQVIADPSPDALVVRDFATAGPDALNALLREESDRRPALISSRLTRLTLVRQADDDHTFVVAGHRMALDPPMCGSILSDVLALYDAFVRGEPSPLADPPFQYVDFVAWQRRLVEVPEVRERMDAARRRLAAATPLALPFDRPQPTVHSTEVHSTPVPIDEKLRTAIRELARAEATTEFVVKLAAFNAFLSIVTGQSDIVVIAPNELARGLDAALGSVLGCFSDYFVMRTDVSGATTLRALIRRTHDVAVDAQRNVDIPCMLVTEDYVEGALWRVVLNPVPVADPSTRASSSGLTVAPIAVPRHRMVDLAWAMFGLRGFFFGASDKLDPSTTARLAGELTTFLERVVSSPDAAFA